MIKSLDNITKSLQQWQRDAAKRVIVVAKTEQPTIERLNTDEQMFNKGERADGAAITPPYTAFTKAVKSQTGQPTNRVTLRDTGAFHRSVSVQWQATEFKLVANDPKTPDLVRKYSLQILGLSDDSLTVLNRFLLPKLQNDFRKSILS
jgi:hypothetical protein